MADLEILERARALIADPKHWTQGALARDRHGRSIDHDSGAAVRFCALGAYCRASGSFDLHRYLRIASEELGFGSLLGIVNDGANENGVSGFRSREDSHAAVLAIYDKAIELAGAEG